MLSLLLLAPRSLSLTLHGRSFLFVSSLFLFLCFSSFLHFFAAFIVCVASSSVPVCQPLRVFCPPCERYRAVILLTAMMITTREESILVRMVANAVMHAFLNDSTRLSFRFLPVQDDFVVGEFFSRALPWFSCTAPAGLSFAQRCGELMLEGRLECLAFAQCSRLCPFAGFALRSLPQRPCSSLPSALHVRNRRISMCSSYRFVSVASSSRETCRSAPDIIVGHFPLVCLSLLFFILPRFFPFPRQVDVGRSARLSISACVIVITRIFLFLLILLLFRL